MEIRLAPSSAAAERAPKRATPEPARREAARGRRSTKLLARELECFARLLDSVARRPTVGNVHALRVASRRCRAAIRIFARGGSSPRADAIRDFCSRLARVSGPARDLDVGGAILRARSGATGLAAWRKARGAARAALARHARTVAADFRELAAAIVAAGGRGKKRIASRFLRRRKRRGRELDAAEPIRSPAVSIATIHAWRRLARRVRYEAELGREFGLDDGGLGERAKRIHRGTAGIADLAMSARLAARFGLRSLAKRLREEARAALRADPSLGMNRRARVEARPHPAPKPRGRGARRAGK